MLINPYTPGAGRLPSYLAGRDKTISEAKDIINNTLAGYPGRPIIYYGLRGVGKTVLLNQIEDEIEDENIIHKYIEVNEQENFKQNISSAIQSAIHKISFAETSKDFLKGVMSSFKAFNAKWSPENGEVSFGFDCDTKSIEITNSGSFVDDLKEMLLLLGKLALKSNKCICFFIDEIQYMKKTDFEALLTAIHRVGQKRFPIIFFGAGLPKILKMAGDVKSYSERLFDFVNIDSLLKPDATDAIIKPAIKLGVEYEPDAIEFIFQETGGYPYFIQEFGEQVWGKINENKLITYKSAIETLPKFLKKLDESFFKVRYDRTTPKEKEFMFAMVKCNNLPCTISQISEIMVKEVESISPCRGKLINKGLIYATGHGALDFTVPQFDLFLKRINPQIN